MKKQILKTIILSIFLVLICSTVSYCADQEGTTKIQITPDGTAWTNINVSESYQKCIELNSTTSTLGTELLNAHLTTNADWSAMAIFSVSQYGGATSNTPTQTNGNQSGIYNIGKNFTYTSGILSGAKSTSTAYVYGLFEKDEEGNEIVKKYVKKWSGNRTETNFVGFIDTLGWLSSSYTYSSNTGMPAIYNKRFV